MTKYELIRHLGTGGLGIVFQGIYDGQDVAVKFQFSEKYKGVREACIYRNKREMGNLRAVAGISGIPKVLVELDDDGNYDKMGFSKFGDVDSLMNPFSLSFGGDPYFQSGFVMEYLGVGVEIKPADFLMGGQVLDCVPDEVMKHDWSEEFFDELETIVRQVHSLGLNLPADISIINSDEKPILVDWYGMGMSDMEMHGGDLKVVDLLRKTLLN